MAKLKESKENSGSSTKDQLIARYAKIIGEKEAEISGIESPRWKTSCSFRPSDGAQAINLHTVKDVEKLTELLAGLISRSRDYGEAASVLGRKKAQFKHQGHSLADWADDIRTEIGKIEIAEKKRVLSELKVKLESLESQEAKEAKALANIAQELENL